MSKRNIYKKKHTDFVLGESDILSSLNTLYNLSYVIGILSSIIRM